MAYIAVIPARGGSKRLPRKNIVDFAGQPIITYTINAAFGTNLFDRVVVSTDDDEIATTSVRAGADIVRRDHKLSSDDARVVEVCLDVLKSEEKEGRHYDLLCCLYPTAPLRSAEDIREVIAMVASGSTDFAMAVTEYDLPVHQALSVERDGSLLPLFPELLQQRSADVPDIVVDNGSTYVARTSSFARVRTFYGPKLRGYVMPRERSVDIDAQADLDYARWLFGRTRLS